MSSKLMGVAIVAAAGAAAAGFGAFLALRDAPPIPSAQVAAVQSAAAGEASAAVTETEVQVGPADTPRAASASVAPTPATSRGVALAPGSRQPRTERPAAAAAAPRAEPRAVAPAPTQPRAAQPAEAPAEPVDARPLPTVSAPIVEPLPLPDPIPPEPQFEELIIPADAVVGLQLETGVSTETARVEDRVEARVTRDVRVAGRVAIPAGSQVEGAVTFVERGGKFKEQARLGVRFHTVVLGDGSTAPLLTETVYREGATPGNKSAAKIGGAAVGGAVLGAILGGGKGAAIGGSIGAAGGAAAVMSGDRNPATLPAGTTLTVRLSGPTTVTVER